MFTSTELKRKAAEAALRFIEKKIDSSIILGVGTGSTTDYFIDGLSRLKGKLHGAVASSKRSAERLIKRGLTVIDLNRVKKIPVYIDSADEIDPKLHMIKGGGGALTREKIVASIAQRFICIADDSKLVKKLGSFPLPIEVVPMASASVARYLIRLGGHPHLRRGFTTDNGNVILDVSGLDITDSVDLEAVINNLAGVVTCGIFAMRGADTAFLATQSGINTLHSARETNGEALR